MQDAKESKIPLDPGHIKKRTDEPALKIGEIYQQAIGALLYLAINTRPDIAASVTLLSQYNKKPTQADWTEVKRTLRYLKGTLNYELTLGKRDAEKKLIGYADADWAEDRKDRKSHSGYVFTFMGGAISWACRKQTCVALSSTEAEYIALAEASQECLWLKRLLKDFLNIEEKEITIFEDNQSCIKLVANKKFSKRSKHIDTKFHFIRELKEEKIVNYQYCPTETMIADMLTKPLNSIKLKFFAEKCGLSAQ